MPGARQYRVLGFIFILAILTIYYVTNGARDTRESEFYRRTVTAMQSKKDAVARQAVIEDERHRQERVDQIRKEHDIAVSTSAGILAGETSKDGIDNSKNQKPIVQEAKDAVAGAVTEAERSVAGRKKMKDDRVVEGKPLKDGDDGVAKVGNVGSKATNVVKANEGEPESEDDHKIEVELGDILKKGPIIVFSKTYCPHSRQAKHILLDLYTITPPPYIVELDTHALGPGLQQALGKSTGRRTVPNVLVNGKSIGGGDDMQELHDSGKLIDTLQSMGGRRVVSVVAKDVPPAAKREVKFKA